MGVVSSINEGREAIRSLPTSPEAIKAGALNMCHSAIDTCKGSGSIKRELGNLASTCAMYPVKIAASGLTACKEIVTGHPIDGVCSALKGATAACTDAAKIITSPIPLASATAQQGLKATKEVVKAPVTVPLAAYRVANRGLEKMLSYMGSNDAPSPANDNAEPPKTAASAPQAA